MFPYVIFHPILYDKSGDIVDRIRILYYLAEILYYVDIFSYDEKLIYFKV